MKYRNFLMTAIAVALVAANAVCYAAQEGVRWTHLGEVSSITGNRLIMTQSQGQEKSFTLTTDAKVTLDGRTIVADELKPGTKIRVTTTKADQTAVRRVEAIDKRSDFVDSFRDGKLVSITGNQLVMASLRGREHSHTLAADAALILDGKACEATDLKPGMKIRATTEGAQQTVVNKIEAIDKTSDFVSSISEGGLSGGTGNQLGQPRTNVPMANEGSNQQATDRSDATTDQTSDAARTQQDGKVIGGTDNPFVQPRTNVPMATEGTSQDATNRSDATTDQKSDAARTQQDGKAVGGTDNQLGQPRNNVRMATEGTDQKATDRSDATDKTSDAARTEQDGAQGANTANVANNHHDGKVVSFTDNRLVMTDLQGKEHPHTLMAKAKLTLDGKVCKPADLKPGTRIRVTTGGADRSVANRIEGIDKNADFASSSREGEVSDGTDNPFGQPRTNVRMATEGTNQNLTDRSEAIDQPSGAARTQQDGAQGANTANVASNRLDGKVVSVTDNRLVMKDQQGQEHSPTLTADCKVTLDGKACKAANLKPGTKICVTTCGADGSEANRIEGIDKNPDFAASSREAGLVGGTDNQLAQPRTNVPMATEGTNQKATDRSDATDESSDAARTQQDGAKGTKAANVAKNRVDGKVVSFTDNRLVMTDLQGQEHSRTLAANAKLTLDGKACEAADLKPGTRIRVTTRGADRSVANRIEGIDKNPDFASSNRKGGQPRGTDNQLVQPRAKVRVATDGTNQTVTDPSSAIDQKSDAAKTHHDGKLVSITGDRLVMTGAGGDAERTCTLATDVRVTCDGKPCKSEELRPGMRIRVTTESKAPHKTIRIEALEKNVEFASL